MGRMIDFSRKQFFLFDMDGTLADSMWLWDGFLDNFLTRFQKNADAEAQRIFDRKPLMESAEYIAWRYNIPLSGETIFKLWTEEILDKYQREILLKKGAAKYLHYLKNNGKRLILVTANHRELAVECLKNNHVLGLFDMLVCGDEMEMDKFDPEYYIFALRQMSGNADRAVLFEDTYTALRTAKQIPIDTVIIEDVSAKADRTILMDKADLYIHNFEEQILYEFESCQ